MARYTNIKRKTDKYTNNRYYVNVIYPEIVPTSEDVYIRTRVGDRLDRLAKDYYGDQSLWWVISRANPDKIKRFSFFIKPGLQIRIPNDISRVLLDFTKLNGSR